jgi:hypothetical protein
VFFQAIDELVQKPGASINANDSLARKGVKESYDDFSKLMPGAAGPVLSLSKQCRGYETDLASPINEMS